MISNLGKRVVWRAPQGYFPFDTPFNKWRWNCRFDLSFAAEPCRAVLIVVATILVLLALPHPAQAEETWARSWSELYNALESAQTATDQVYISIGQQFDRHEGDPDLVMHSGNVVLDINGFTIDPRVNGQSAGNGRVLTVEGGTITIVGDTEAMYSAGGLSHGSADLGGAILVEGGELCLDGGVLSANNAQQGGCIAITGGTCTITDGTIYSNSATQGGAIYVGPQGSLCVSGGQIYSNNAHLGGGIYVDGTEQATICGGELHDNTALNGGGVYVCGTDPAQDNVVVPENLIIQDGALIRANKASLSGGNLCVGPYNTAIVKMTGGTLSEGNAANGGGVAVLTGSFTMLGGTISNNKASCGAGLAVLGGVAYIEESGSICDNVGSLKGGGAFVAEDGLCRVWGGSIQNNRAETAYDETEETETAEGGGVYVATGGSFEVQGSPTLESNTRGDVGQDVYLEHEAIVGVNGAFTPSAPVGIDVADLPELNETREVVAVGAYAEDAFACQAPDCEMVYEVPSTGNGHALIKRVREHEGTRVTSWADLSQYLRALKSEEEASFWLEGDATYGQGQPEEYATRTLEVRKNAKVTIDLNGYAINRGLSAQDVPSEEDSERCIYVSKGSLTIRDGRGGGRICGGCCQRGGGVFVSEGSLVLEGGSITDNKATFGGGVYVGLGSFELRDGRIYNNVGLAQGQPCGGGVYVGDNNSLAGLEPTNSGTDNEPSGGEPGEETGDNKPDEDEVTQANMTMLGGSIDVNKAAGWGAGICVSNGVLTMEGGTVDSNTQADDAKQGGGGIYATGNSSVTMTSGSVTNNKLLSKEGAGISIKDNSKAVLSGGTISNNSSSWDGGGVCAQASALDVSGVTISNNTSRCSGGGMVLQSGSTCTISSGSINSNHANNNGGGVMVYYGADCTMSGGNVSQNLAWNDTSEQFGKDTSKRNQGNVSGELEGDDPGFTRGGGFDVKGKLTVSGGTITNNNSILGCGICFDGANWQTEKAQVVLSGSPTICNNYIPTGSQYEPYDLSIYMYHDEDDSAMITIEGTFKPTDPVAIEKLYRPDYGDFALVGKGDYALDAFKSAQSYESGSSPFELVQRDGILYAHRDAPSDDEDNTSTQGSGNSATTSTSTSSTAKSLPKTGDTLTFGAVAASLAIATLTLSALATNKVHH